MLIIPGFIDYFILDTQTALSYTHPFEKVVCPYQRQNNHFFRLLTEGLKIQSLRASKKGSLKQL